MENYEPTMIPSSEYVKGLKSRKFLGSKTSFYVPQSEFNIEHFLKVLIKSSSNRSLGLLTEGEQDSFVKLGKLVEAWDASISIQEDCMIKKELKNWRDIDVRKKEKLSKRIAEINSRRVKGRIAMVILSALERCKGDRGMIDQIGHLIEEGGDFHKQVDLKYGSGRYDLLKIPCVNFYKNRWDADIKKQLIPAARSFVMKERLVSDRLYHRVTGKQRVHDLDRADDTLYRSIRHSYQHGYSAREIGEMEYYSM